MIEKSNNADVLRHDVRLSAADVVWSAHSITSFESTTATSRSLLFECGGLLLALSADSVREVIDVPAVSPVPGSPAWFAGVAIYRNRPVPLMDAAAYLEPDQSDTKQKPARRIFNRAIVVHLASSTYLIAAEKILNLCNLPLSGLSLNSPVTQQLPDYAEHRAINSVSSYDNRLVAMIDLPELLRCTKLLRECAFC